MCEEYDDDYKCDCLEILFIVKWDDGERTVERILKSEKILDNLIDDVGVSGYIEYAYLSERDEPFIEKIQLVFNNRAGLLDQIHTVLAKQDKISTDYEHVITDYRNFRLQ